MATVMVKEGKHKKVHNEIKQLGNDIGFQPILCQSRRPKSKGTVKNLAKLCDRLKSYNNEFETLEDLINVVNKFNEECGKEKSQAHNKIVNEVFKEEKKYLLPLPNKNILERYKQNILEKRNLDILKIFLTIIILMNFMFTLNQKNLKT